MLRILCAGLVLALGLLANPAAAEKRVALVIGNASYKNAPALRNPVNDAKAVAAALKRLNFEVMEGTDLDLPGMNKLLRKYGEEVEGADVAFVFYSGHGMQVGGDNYLIPITAMLDKEQDLRFETMKLEDVMELTNTAKKLSILVLDACRDNPFKTRLSQNMGTRSTSVGRGLARVEPMSHEMLIAYATGADNVAQDGKGADSPFTEALLKHMETPGLEVGFLFRKVRDDVVKSTDGKQEPAVYGSLGGDEIYLKPKAAEAAPAPVAAAPAAPDAKQLELAFWDSIKSSTTASDYQAYLDTYPKGAFAALARSRLAALGKATAVATAEPRSSNPAGVPAPPPPAAAAPTAAKAAPQPTPAAAAAPKPAPQQQVAMAVPKLAPATAPQRSASDALVRQGEAAAGSKNFAEAMRLYKEAADQGSSAAEFAIGVLYARGMGAQRNLTEATRWFNKADGHGDVRARYAASLIHAFPGLGDDVGNGRHGPLQEVRIEAMQGEANAQLLMGIANEFGLGTDLDLAAALGFYRKSADQGVAAAQYFLALMYADGQGTAKDPTQARTFMTKAADNGDPNAKRWLSGH